MGDHGTHEATTTARSPENTDRLMVGACGAIWLVVLVVSVIATVACVNLGRGGAQRAGESSSWLLYTIIAVSALTILAAIPLLMRARRTASRASVSGAGQTAPEPPARAAEEAPTEKMRVFGAAVDPSAPPGPTPAERAPQRAVAARNALVDRLSLRGAASLLGAMGLAELAVATATYLLAVHSDTAALVALIVAGVITVGMPAVLVAYQRRLVPVRPAADALA